MSEENNAIKINESYKNMVINVARKAGKVILQNGGETYRAEETCAHICKHFGAVAVNALAITTGIVLAVDFAGPTITTVSRIDNRCINLEKISQANDISRSLENGTMTLEEANDKLNELLIDSKKNRSAVARLALRESIGTGFAGAFFSILFGGGFSEFCIALFSGICVALINVSSIQLKANAIINSIVSGIVSALIALSFSLLVPGFRYDLVIIGSIMPLLPGIAMTNAFRDSISGDLISGVSRLLEAFISAIAVATGVGIVISLFIHFGLIGGFTV